MRQAFKFPLAWSGVAALLIATAIAAPLTGQAAFEQRRDAMKQLGKDFYVGVGRVVKGRAAYGPDTVTAAENIVRVVATLDPLFPKGSDVADSKVKAELLADPAKSAALLTTVRAAAAGLVPAVRSGDKTAIAASYKTMADACDACHTPFRKDE